MLKLNVKKAYEELENTKGRSAWERGIIDYAFDLLDNLENYFPGEKEISFEDAAALKTILLNGADNWRTYSYGGCSLVYDYDIARRLCTPSEFKKKKEGDLMPNCRENWLDVQTRALHQAFSIIKYLCEEV